MTPLRGIRRVRPYLTLAGEYACACPQFDGRCQFAEPLLTPATTLTTFADFVYSGKAKALPCNDLAKGS